MVRGSEKQQPITALDYEAFEPMARRQFELVFQEIEKHWPLESVRLVHRVGVVNVNEPSLWVEVIPPQRGEDWNADYSPSCVVLPAPARELTERPCSALGVILALNEFAGVQRPPALPGRQFRV